MVRESLSTRKDFANACSSIGSGTNNGPALTNKGKITKQVTNLNMERFILNKKRDEFTQGIIDLKNNFFNAT